MRGLLARSRPALIPNAETVEAMKPARRGEVVKVGSVDDLLADFRTGDRIVDARVGATGNGQA